MLQLLLQGMRLRHARLLRRRVSLPPVPVVSQPASAYEIPPIGMAAAAPFGVQLKRRLPILALHTHRSYLRTPGHDGTPISRPVPTPRAALWFNRRPATKLSPALIDMHEEAFLSPSANVLPPRLPSPLQSGYGGVCSAAAPRMYARLMPSHKHRLEGVPIRLTTASCTSAGNACCAAQTRHTRDTHAA